MISLEDARQLLGEEGRRLSDEEVRQRNDESRAIAQLICDLFLRERAEGNRPRSAAA